MKAAVLPPALLAARRSANCLHAWLMRNVDKSGHSNDSGMHSCQAGLSNPWLRAAITTGSLSLAGDLLAQGLIRRHQSVSICTAPLPEELQLACINREALHAFCLKKDMCFNRFAVRGIRRILAVSESVCVPRRRCIPQHRALMLCGQPAWAAMDSAFMAHTSTFGMGSLTNSFLQRAWPTLGRRYATAPFSDPTGHWSLFSSIVTFSRALSAL